MPPPVSATVYVPEYPLTSLTRIREPSGRTLGSAATIPGRVMLPEAVLPCSEYAVATNSSPGRTARVACRGTGRGGGTRVEQPAKHAAVNRLTASAAKCRFSRE